MNGGGPSQRYTLCQGQTLIPGQKVATIRRPVCLPAARVGEPFPFSFLFLFKLSTGTWLRTRSAFPIFVLFSPSARCWPATSCLGHEPRSALRPGAQAYYAFSVCWCLVPGASQPTISSFAFSLFPTSLLTNICFLFLLALSVMSLLEQSSSLLNNFRSVDSLCRIQHFYVFFPTCSVIIK